MKRTIALLGFLALLSACGKSSSTGDATAKLQFSRAARMFNIADSFAPTPARFAASTFKMKFIAAYLTADIAAGTGNNVGTTTMIYLNPECSDDIMHCDVSSGTAEDGAPMSHVLSTFFDFSSSTAANTAINAQGRSITSGTYKYARLEFCKYATGSDPNIQWAYATAGASGSFKQASCTATSAEIVPPITIASGGSATVTMSYDISNAVANTAGTSSNCNLGHCFTVPSFTPSATVRY